MTCSFVMSRSSVRFWSLAHKPFCNRKRFIMPSPLLVVSDCEGNTFEIPGIFMAGSSLNSIIVPDNQSLIPLPRSSVLYILPKRIPIGYDAKQKKFIEVKEYNGSPVFATAAFMPPGYIRTFHSAYVEASHAPRLPLYCYSAVGFRNGRFYVAGIRIDRQKRHEITEQALSNISLKSGSILKRYPGNRLVSHLVNNCALKYNCPNACNFILGRWECPIPVSSTCNAGCIGCISKQPKDSRIGSILFRPSRRLLIMLCLILKTPPIPLQVLDRDVKESRCFRQNWPKNPFARFAAVPIAVL
jgi:hypothetical protein